jgi:hypothetical protein
VRCAQGCYDAAVSYQTPFISGKDSLNNEYTGSDGQKHAIPGTLLISALGIVPDVNKTVTMDLKRAGDFLFIVGETGAELGGSHFGLVGGTIQPQHANVPKAGQRAGRLPQAPPGDAGRAGAGVPRLRRRRPGRDAGGNVPGGRPGAWKFTSLHAPRDPYGPTRPTRRFCSRKPEPLPGRSAPARFRQVPRMHGRDAARVRGGDWRRWCYG